MANYLDNLASYTAQATLVIAELGYESYLLWSTGQDDTTELRTIARWDQYLQGANDTDQTDDLRLALLTLLVNQARLNNMVTVPGIAGLYQSIAPVEISSVPFDQITGSPLSNAALAAQFNLYLLKTGGTITGPLLLSSTRIDVSAAGALNLGTVTATSINLGQVGTPIHTGTITTGVWGATAIPIAKGGTGQVALGTALQVLRTNAAANATEWATIATGDVTGPGSSIDNAIARFDGVTGKIIQSSGVVISDGNGIQGAATLSMNGSTSGFTLITPSAIAGSNTQTLQASTGTIALLENRLDAFAATTSAQLATVISDETGSGALVFATSPTLTTPVIGAATGTSLVLSGALTSGVASSAAGTVVLRNATNAFTQTIRGTNPAASIIYDLPTTAPTVGQYLSASAPSAGVVTLSWGTITALVNPMSALGDLIYGAAAGAPTRLAGDTSNTRKFLRSLSVASVATAPVWDTLLAADIPTIAQSQVSGLVTALTNKLGTGLTDGYFFVGNAANAAVGVAMSQDGTIDNTGALTISDGVVTFAKMQDITFQTLVGRWSAGDGPPQEISIGSGLSLSGAGVLSASGGGTGDVVGPASATDNAIARFDTTTGKLIQNSAVLIADTTGVISGTQGITFSGTTSGTTSLVATAIAGTTILTMPAATDTLVGKATTDTFTNKTLTASTNVLGGVTMTLGSDGTGDIYYRSAGNVLTRLGVGSNGDVLTLAAGLPSWAAGGGGGGANTALSNLAAVAINAALIPATAGALDIGSTTKPWGDLWLAGSSGTPATNQFRITGASTSGVRTVTLQDASGTVAYTADLAAYIAKSGATAISSVLLTGDFTVLGGTGSGTYGLITLDGGAASLSFVDPSGSGNAAWTVSAEFQISSSNALFIGAAYDIDYSANYTNRSLVDKAYVDAQVSGLGDFVGPASSTDNAILRFDGTTGKLGQNSVVTIADTTGVIAGTQGITLSGTTSGTTSLVATAIAGTTISTLPATTTTLAGLAVTQTFTAANTFSLAGSTGVAITISGAGSSTNAGLTFTSSSRGWINMGTSGDAVGAPTFTTRSQGTKIVLYPLVAGATVDYALGINTNVLWTSVPDSARSFLWYAGTTTVLTLSGAGNITTVGSLTMADAKDIILNTTTGTKIGTATTQKLAVWNATPIVQPTTAVAAATFVANTSLIANDTATFDGYTLGQVVKALRNIGLLA